MKSGRHSLPLAAALSLVLAAPAMAHGVTPPADAHDPRPEWTGGPAAVPQPASHNAAWEQARADWLAECRRRQGTERTVGGAVIGGLVGGVVGNRVAGEGNRTVGTVVGAAAGAGVGAAVGSAADRSAARDYCEAYLDQYLSQQGQHGHGYSYGYAPMVVMVPVTMVAVSAPAQTQGQPGCTETIVTEEYVTEASASRRRYVAPRPRVRHEKRVRVAPDKRVRL
jgi:uncharacterized protein YcfJ